MSPSHFLLKCLFKSFAHFMGLFIFLLLMYGRFEYVLDTSPRQIHVLGRVWGLSFSTGSFVKQEF